MFRPTSRRALRYLKPGGGALRHRVAMPSPSSPAARTGPDRALTAEQLFARCDPAAFPWADTGALPDPEFPFGQQRAMEAVKLGLETHGPGYNIFVLGRPGSGRHAIVQRLLESHALGLPAPEDCCYIHNFADPQKPRVLALPAGEGARFHREMQAFVTELGKAVQAAFEGDEYRSRLEAIQKDYKQREEAALQALCERASAEGLALVHSPQGLAFTPVSNRQPLREEEFEQLSKNERERLATATHELADEAKEWMQQLPRLRREMQARIRAASRDTLSLAAGHLVEELKSSFAAHTQVIAFLEEVLQDIVETGEQFRTELRGEDEDEEIAELSGSLFVSRYQVNLLVSREASDRAPVVICDNPTHPQLVGRVDHVSHMGALLTNFTMIKPGALHRANGGFLLLDAVHVLARPESWDALKRSLKAGKVTIESVAEAMGLGASAPALEPQPVPLSVKVVLVGEREHYYLLQALDTEFDPLFRVAADFEDDVPRTDGTVAVFAQSLGALARAHQMRPCDPGAIARLVEEASRVAGHAGRLSTHMSLLEELLQEADTAAGRTGDPRIAAAHVHAAVAAREHRSDRLRDRLQQQFLERTLLVDTESRQVGQVNGLAVADLGDFRFGYPVRITATARLGEERVLDVERESALGQPLHSKGILILSSYLAARYVPSAPLSLAASLVFEQSYGPVEGDSASLAELCALLSALARAPLKQALAVTGSVNQFGGVQAVGAINEKVEGFYDLCRARGLTGAQGVVIPAANLPHLMLRAEVVHAVREGNFHVWCVEHVDEAIGLMSSVPAGAADSAGCFAPDSFNGRVAQRLEQLSVARQSFALGQHPKLRKARHRAPVAVIHIASDSSQ